MLITSACGVDPMPRTPVAGEGRGEENGFRPPAREKEQSRGQRFRAAKSENLLGA